LEAQIKLKEEIAKYQAENEGKKERKREKEINKNREKERGREEERGKEKESIRRNLCSFLSFSFTFFLYYTDLNLQIL
jgi:hypothetical protein